MTNKRLIILFLIGILIFNQGIPVLAGEYSKVSEGIGMEKSITPMWENTSDVILDLYFKNGNAECVGKINGFSGTSNISATFKLERRKIFGWTLEKSWNSSSKGKALSFLGTKAVAKGHTYRLSVTAKVTRNGVIETISTSVNGKY